MFRVFSAFVLDFLGVLLSFRGGKKSLVFWVVFLGFYPNTKERKGRAKNLLRLFLTSEVIFISRGYYQKAADVWKKDVWDFQVLSQTLLELRFSLRDKGKNGKNLSSQTWPGSPRRPSPRHPRPADTKKTPRLHCKISKKSGHSQGNFYFWGYFQP